jgi:hypothetical protein
MCPVCFFQLMPRGSEVVELSDMFDLRVGFKRLAAADPQQRRGRDADVIDRPECLPPEDFARPAGCQAGQAEPESAKKIE